MFDHCLYFNVNWLARAVNRLWDDAYSELDLAPAHAYLLRLVIAKPGLIQKQIAGELHLDKSTVNRFVDKMEKDGYLIRGARDEDRRVAVYPTAAAKGLADRLSEIDEELNRAMQVLLGKDEVKAIVELSSQASTHL